MKVYLVVFLSVFLAELGDKTQLATLDFAPETGTSKLAVVVAAAAALTMSTAIAVLIGSHVGAWLPPAQLKVLAALAFIAIGVWILVTGWRV